MHDLESCLVRQSVGALPIGVRQAMTVPAPLQDQPQLYKVCGSKQGRCYKYDEGVFPYGSIEATCDTSSFSCQSPSMFVQCTGPCLEENTQKHGLGCGTPTLILARHGSLQVSVDIGHNHKHHACAQGKEHPCSGPAPGLPSLLACSRGSVKGEQHACICSTH